MNKQGQFEKRIMALPQPDRSILIKKINRYHWVRKSKSGG